MRKVLWIVMLLLLAGNGWAQTQRDVDRFTGGIWWNANQSGHGFTIEVISETLTVIYWYVYHPDGTPTFLIAVATANNGHEVHATAYYYSGMKFGVFDTLDIINTQGLPGPDIWGTLKLKFHDCNSATLEYSSQLDFSNQMSPHYNGVPFGDGTIQLTKNANTDQMQCADNPNAGIYLGNFQSFYTGEVFPGQAVLSPDGGYAVYGISPSSSLIAGTGNWGANGTLFLGGGKTVGTVQSAPFDSDIYMQAQIMPEYRVKGAYDIGTSNVDAGTFDFYAAPSLYRRGISLPAISGVYDLEDLSLGGLTGRVSVFPDGSLSGQDSSLCNYIGNLTLPDPDFNVFKVTYSLSGCGMFDGQYTGYGAQTDVDNLDDREGLRLVATNDSIPGFAGAFELTRGCEEDPYEDDDASINYDIGTNGDVDKQKHSICLTGDQDWVGFNVTEESQVVIETTGPEPNSDTFLQLFNVAGFVFLEEDDDGGTQPYYSKIDRLCSADALPIGRYAVRVNEFGDDATIDEYFLTVTATPCP